MQRNKVAPQQASDEDEAKGKALYERYAAMWPKPMSWDDLMNSQQYLWIQRAKEKKHD